MSNEHFDLIAIGGGSAARDGARKAKDEFGARVALIESTRWGGDCPNVACRPTKAYLVAADLLHDIQTLAPKAGIEVGPARADLAKVKARKNAIRSTQQQWVERLRAQGFATYDGVATFLDPHTLQVGEHELTADRILIATGSLTAIPPIDGLAEVGSVDHVTALDLEEVPESLLILGAGPVGLEFAQIFARFGSRVTLVQTAERISPRSDAEAAAEVAQALEEDGIEILTSTSATRFARDGDEIVATLDPAGERRVALVLVATGRRPNTADLGLEVAGVATNRAAIAVDQHMRTNQEGLYAIGDATGISMLAHTASYQGEVAVTNALAEKRISADYTSIPACVYTDPEIAYVGLSEAQARAQGTEVKVGQFPFSALGRAQVLGETQGLVKVVADSDGYLLGVTILGPRATDLIAEAALAVNQGLSAAELSHTVHAHPTLPEALAEAALDVAGRAVHIAPRRRPA